MADLAKYGEVQHISTVVDDSGDERVNKLLQEGWELVTAKVVEAQERVSAGLTGYYIRKRAEAHYVLGRRRSAYTSSTEEYREVGLHQDNL